MSRKIDDLGAVAEKYNGEIVGGRVIVVIDGHKRYATEVGPEGRYFTLLGEALERGDESVDETNEVVPEDVVVEKPKRNRKKEVAMDSGATLTDEQVAQQQALQQAATDAPVVPEAPASIDDEVAKALAS